jgi:serine/threonine-protein kinase
VIEFGTLDSGAPFIVMEYLTGIDLGDLLEQGGPLPVPVAVDYVLQACEAIAEAHSLGIVHRDLKPPNLFLAERPDGTSTVKVLDFGLSTAPLANSDGKVDSLTSTDMVAGSPHFMSPEQVRSLKHVDAHTDIWALGVILYQLVSGALPFDADAVTGVIAKILTDPPVPLSARRPDVPPGLEAVILRCLEKSVERRMASVSELATALAPYGSAACRPSVETIVRLQSPTRGGPHSAGSSGALPAVSASTAASTLGDGLRDMATTQRPAEPPPAPRAPTPAETLDVAPTDPAPPSIDTPAVVPGDRADEGAPSPAPRPSRAVRVGVAVAVLVLAPLAVLAVVRGGGPAPERPVTPGPEAASVAASTLPPTPAPSASGPLVTPGPVVSAAPAMSASAAPSASVATPAPKPPTSGPLPAASGRPGPAVRRPAGKDDPLDRWQ